MNLAQLQERRLKKTQREVFGWRVAGDKVVPCYERANAMSRDEADKQLRSQLERQHQYDQILKVIESGQTAHRNKIERANKAHKRRMNQLEARQRCGHNIESFETQKRESAQERDRIVRPLEALVEADWKMWNDKLLVRLDELLPRLWPLVDDYREENGALNLKVSHLREILAELDISVEQPKICVVRMFARVCTLWVRTPRTTDTTLFYNTNRRLWKVRRRIDYRKRVWIRADHKKKSDACLRDKKLALLL